MSSLPYVYALVDPRDDATFYIGKGTNARMRQHAADARRGKSINPAKTARILEIHAAGLEVGCRVIATCGSHEEAYDLERHLVATTDGLTNIRPGGYGGPNDSASPANPLNHAQSLLRRTVPFMDWINERPRTNEEMDLYHLVVATLRRLVTLAPRTDAPVAA